MTGKEVARGRFLEQPEVLVVHRHAESDELAIDYDKALENAKSQANIETISFVDFPTAGLTGQALTDQQALMKAIQSWQSWSSVLVEGKVQQQIDAKVLPADNAVKCGTYRTKVFDYLMRQAPWFARTFDRTVNKHISVKKVEFHAAILMTVLEGFFVPSSVFINLEKILHTISDGIIKASTQAKEERQQFWIMLTSYKYLKEVQMIQTTVRTIFFTVSQQAREYTLGKSKYESVEFDLEFVQYQCDFNNDIYGKVKENIDQELISKGMGLAKMKTITADIPID